MNLNVKFSSAEEEMDVRFKENNASIPVEFGGSVISGAQFWFGTRDEYNAIPSPNPNICYCIEEGT